MNRACMDPVRHAIKDKRSRLTPEERGCLASLVCNAAYTNDRFKQSGYICTDRCPFGCGAKDSIVHRIVECTATASQRAELMGNTREAMLIKT